MHWWINGVHWSHWHIFEHPWNPVVRHGRASPTRLNCVFEHSRVQGASLPFSSTECLPISNIHKFSKYLHITTSHENWQKKSWHLQYFEVPSSGTNDGVSPEPPLWIVWFYLHAMFRAWLTSTNHDFLTTGHKMVNIDVMVTPCHRHPSWLSEWIIHNPWEKGCKMHVVFP